MNYSSTNFEKYQTKNPVVRNLIDKFFDKIRAAVYENLPHDAARVLDAGCGEGETVSQLGSKLENLNYVGLDFSLGAVKYSVARHHQNQATKFLNSSIYNLPFSDRTFDAAFCFEVLEHLETPEKGLAELDRVTRGPLIVSVPYEPYFQLGNLMRGKYLQTLGNHPEHVNHWNLRTFKNFLQTRRKDVKVTSSFPWIIGVAR
ncbi:class I SAM-dependent methyltransferase [bacterium]|nr:class I SAM-dependent methyltransferase [bacterium]